MLQVIHLANTTSVLHGNTSLLLKVTRDHNLSSTWARWIQQTPTFTSYFFTFHFNSSILLYVGVPYGPFYMWVSHTTLLYVGVPYGPFPSDFSTNFLMQFPLLMHAARPVNLLPFEPPKNIYFKEQTLKLQYAFFKPPITPPFLLGPMF
jgi:hypothetical protein